MFYYALIVKAILFTHIHVISSAVRYNPSIGIRSKLLSYCQTNLFTEKKSLVKSSNEKF